MPVENSPGSGPPFIYNVSAPRLQHMKSLYPEVEAMTDYQAMLDGDGVDAVVVATAVRCHYGELYIPYLKQEEPLKVECQHFLDCIATGQEPASGGRQGWELVRILEGMSTPHGPFS